MLPDFVLFRLRVYKRQVFQCGLLCLEKLTVGEQKEREEEEDGKKKNKMKFELISGGQVVCV